MSSRRGSMNLRQRFMCDYTGCCKSFRLPEQLTDHVFQVHKMIMVSTPDTNWDSDADSDVDSNNNDESYSDKEIGDTPAKSKSECSNCGKRMLRTSLTKHEINCVHKGQTSFTCIEPQCKAIFKTPGAMKSHYSRVHAPLVKCIEENCQIQVKPMYLRQHIKRAHQRSRIQCSTCEVNMPLYAYPAHKKICDLIQDQNIEPKKKGRKTKTVKPKIKLNINRNESMDMDESSTTTIVQQTDEGSWKCVLDYCKAVFLTEKEKYIHEFDTHCSIVYQELSMPILDDDFEEEFLRLQNLNCGTMSKNLTYFQPESEEDFKKLDAQTSQEILTKVLMPQKSQVQNTHHTQESSNSQLFRGTQDSPQSQVLTQTQESFQGAQFQSFGHFQPYATSSFQNPETEALDLTQKRQTQSLSSLQAQEIPNLQATQILSQTQNSTTLPSQESQSPQMPQLGLLDRTQNQSTCHMSTVDQQYLDSRNSEIAQFQLLTPKDQIQRLQKSQVDQFQLLTPKSRIHNLQKTQFDQFQLLTPKDQIQKLQRSQVDQFQQLTPQNQIQRLQQAQVDYLQLMTPKNQIQTSKIIQLNQSQNCGVMSQNFTYFNPDCTSEGRVLDSQTSQLILSQLLTPENQNQNFSVMDQNFTYFQPNSDTNVQSQALDLQSSGLILSQLLPRTPENQAQNFSPGTQVQNYGTMSQNFTFFQPEYTQILESPQAQVLDSQTSELALSQFLPQDQKTNYFGNFQVVYIDQLEDLQDNVILNCPTQLIK